MTVQNIKIKLKSRTWITLNSLVIFQAWEPLQPKWPLQPHFITDHDVLIIPGTQIPHTLWQTKLFFCLLAYFAQKRDILEPKTVQKIKIKLKSRTWMTLKYSLVILMYFRSENQCSFNDLHSPEQSPWPQWPLEPHFNNKEILIMMFWSFLAPKLPMQVLFSWMHDHKSKFLLISEPFL